MVSLRKYGTALTGRTVCADCSLALPEIRAAALGSVIYYGCKIRFLHTLMAVNELPCGL